MTTTPFAPTTRPTAIPVRDMLGTTRQPHRECGRSVAATKKGSIPCRSATSWLLEHVPRARSPCPGMVRTRSIGIGGKD
jgi:hypothetical protein